MAMLGWINFFSWLTVEHHFWQASPQEIDDVPSCKAAAPAIEVYGCAHADKLPVWSAFEDRQDGFAQPKWIASFKWGQSGVAQRREGNSTRVTNFALACLDKKRRRKHCRTMFCHEYDISLQFPADQSFRTFRLLHINTVMSPSTWESEVTTTPSGTAHTISLPPMLSVPKLYWGNLSSRRRLVMVRDR